MKREAVVVAILFALAVPAAVAEETPAKPTLVVKYSDGKADGKKSIDRTGEMITELHFPVQLSN